MTIYDLAYNEYLKRSKKRDGSTPENVVAHVAMEYGISPRELLKKIMALQGTRKYGNLSWAEEITYEQYCDMLDHPAQYLLEGITDDAKKKGLEYFGFGRYGKNGTVTHVSAAGKLVPFTGSETKGDDKEDDDDDESAAPSAKHVAKKLNAHIDSIASDLKASREHIVSAFKQPHVYNTLKHFGFSFNKAASAAVKGLATFNVGLRSTFEELHKTNVLKKLEKGAVKVDEVLTKYPALKKVGGPAIAGFLVYQWQNMAFSGDFDDDFDISAIGKALAGDYSIRDVFASPSGLKGLTQLAAGIAIGVTFPWGKIGPATLKMAALYTGAKKLKNTELAAKAMARLKDEAKK